MGKLEAVNRRIENTMVNVKRTKTNNDLQTITQKTTDWATQIPPGMNSDVPDGLAVSAPPVTPVVLLLIDTINYNSFSNINWYIVQS